MCSIINCDRAVRVNSSRENYTPTSWIKYTILPHAVSGNSVSAALCDGSQQSALCRLLLAEERETRCWKTHLHLDERGIIIIYLPCVCVCVCLWEAEWEEPDLNSYHIRWNTAFVKVLQRSWLFSIKKGCEYGTHPVIRSATMNILWCRRKRSGCLIRGSVQSRVAKNHTICSSVPSCAPWTHHSLRAFILLAETDHLCLSGKKRNPLCSALTVRLSSLSKPSR